MLTLLRKEQLLNTFLALLCVFSIVVVSLILAINHQYKIIKSRNIADQYEKKLDIVDDINSNIELITLCQININSMHGMKADQEILQECKKYPAELDSKLKKLSEFYKSNNDITQNIAIIINRKNQQVLDQHSINLANQLIDQLNKDLAEEQKQLPLLNND